MVTKVSCQIGGRELSFESGRVAKQADGAVWVRYGGTVIIATAVAAREAAEDRDFFPLTVDFREKTFAGGYLYTAPDRQRPVLKPEGDKGAVVATNPSGAYEALTMAGEYCKQWPADPREPDGRARKYPVADEPTN